MFTKLIAYLGDDVVVLSIQGCVSVVGFQFGTIWMSGNKDKTIKRVIIQYLCLLYAFQFDPHAVRSF